MNSPNAQDISINIKEHLTVYNSKAWDISQWNIV